MRRANSQNGFSRFGRLRLQWAAFLLCWAVVASAYGQDGAGVQIRFYFSEGARKNLAPVLASPEITSAFEQAVSTKLVDVCAKSDWFRHWAFRANKGAHSIEVYVAPTSNNEWRLTMVLKHQEDLRWEDKTEWSSVLFRSEDISTRGRLPATKEQWVSAVGPAFAKMMDTHSSPGNKILRALQYFVPLGTEVVTVQPPRSRRPGAVLSLTWTNNEDLSNCRFRIKYDYLSANKLIFIYSAGTGGHMTFRPSQPLYEAVWVQHRGWAEGGLDAEPIANHLGELEELDRAKAEFFVESCDRVTSDVSIIGVDAGGK